MFDLKFVLDVLLPEVVDFLSLLIHLYFSLCDLVDQLFRLTLHVGNEFDFCDVLSLKHFNFYLHFLAADVGEQTLAEGGVGMSIPPANSHCRLTTVGIPAQ